MRHYSKLTTIPFIRTALFLFLLLQISQALASDNDTIRQHIKKIATENAILSNSQVTIYVEDGFVLLTGTVQLYLQKMDFEQIAWKTKGVTEVENEIEVKSEFPLSDTAIERKVRMILMDCECFHGGKYIITVSKGVVSVTGVFFHPRDVQILKRQIAEIEGIVGINIHATPLITETPESRP
ncbi:MAG: BON domain-containing protein [Desulforhopalus sp.]|nr:BON domain-containing protein [Desulforhopalus sp.]